MKRWIGLLSLCMIVLLANSSPALGQTWARTYGSTGVDWTTVYGSSVRQTSDGGYIVWGTGFFSGSDQLYTAIKLDALGAMVWQKSFETPSLPGGGGAHHGSIQELSGGGYVAVGYVPAGSGEGIWVVNLDPLGSIVWQKLYDGPGRDVGISIQETTLGGLIVAGHSVSFGASVDFWILSLDPLGNILWQNTYGDGSNEEARSIQEVSSGGFIVAGKSSGDYWVLRLDFLGGVIWQKRYGGGGTDIAQQIQETSDGGFVVGGATSGFGTSGGAWILKLDADGNIVWQKIYDGADHDDAMSVQQTSDGGYIATGGTYSFGAGDTDTLVLKLNPTGDISWQRTYGSVDFERSEFVEQTSDGGYVLGGGKEVLATGATDMYLLKLDPQGNIAGCPAGTSALTAIDTSVAPVDTNVTGISTDISATTPTFLAVSASGSAQFDCARVSACPVDLDGDGILNDDDNCPTICNPSQADTGSPGPPSNGIGDACDGPGDREPFYGVAVSAGPNGVIDTSPSNDDVHVPGCPVIWAGNDGFADTVAMPDDVQVLAVGMSQDCDPVIAGPQGDGVPDGSDNCPVLCNATQDDVDGDGIGDACCPGIVAGSDYCISGNSSGDAYSWGFDVGLNGTVDPGEPQSLTASTPPIGADASALATEFAASIAVEETYPSTSATANCFTVDPPSPGDLYVGTVGVAPVCKVTSSGCSYNPEIFCVEPAGSPELTVSGFGADTDLDWGSLFTGSTYDVVRGDVGTLRASGGDFALATEECVADNHPANALTFSGNPASGVAFWFLVRGAHCGGGTHDTASPSQVASRDGGIAVSGLGCP